MSKLVIFCLLVAAVAFACVSAQFPVVIHPDVSTYYNPYGYTYPVTYGYRFGAYPYLLRR